MSSEPVSWLLIEQGWDVVDAEDESVGRVEEIVADRDIFSGLVVSSGLLGKPKWVQAEDVAELQDGQVRLALSGSAVEQLPDYEPPAPA